MSKANIYHYCSGKEDLFYKTHFDCLQRCDVPVIDEADSFKVWELCETGVTTFAGC